MSSNHESQPDDLNHERSRVEGSQNGVPNSKNSGNDNLIL